MWSVTVFASADPWTTTSMFIGDEDIDNFGQGEMKKKVGYKGETKLAHQSDEASGPDRATLHYHKLQY